MRLVTPTIALLLICVTAGCRTTPGDAPNPAPLSAEAYDRAFDASVAVLRDHRYEVDREDHRFGRVTTLPKDAPTVFEPWLDDNATAAQAWQSTLDHQRRTVSLFFEPTDAGDYELRVEVLVERRVQPTRRLTSRSGGNVFSTLDAVPAEWSRRGIDRRYWEPVGRDAWLEQRLMREIRQRADMNF